VYSRYKNPKIIYAAIITSQLNLLVMIFWQGNILDLENREIECLETFGLLAISLMTMLILSPLFNRHKNLANIVQLVPLALGVFYRFLDLNQFKEYFLDMILMGPMFGLLVILNTFIVQCIQNLNVEIFI
jgi:hypothetical protein